MDGAHFPVQPGVAEQDSPWGRPWPVVLYSLSPQLQCMPSSAQVCIALGEQNLVHWFGGGLGLCSLQLSPPSWHLYGSNEAKVATWAPSG